MTDRDLLLHKHRIEIEDSLGRGSQGQVFRARRLARDGRTSMPCAVKICPYDDSVVEPSKKLLEEIDSMVRLCDSNYVVRLLDVIVETTFLALVLEECTQSFADLLEQRQSERPGLGLPRAECYRLVEQIARGLGDCQADNVIHGDVKPQNMLLTRRGDAKLCDFGTARLWSSPTTLTSHGGTLVFMLPRHCEKLTCDRDVFGLAISYAYLRLGRHPFEHNHPASGRFDLMGLDDDEIHILCPILADEHIPATDVYGWFRQLDADRMLQPTLTGTFDVSVKLLVDRVDCRRWKDGYQPDERDIEDIRHAQHLLEEYDSAEAESAEIHALRSRVLTALADLTAGSSESKKLFTDALEAINKAIALAPNSAEYLAYRADLRLIADYGGMRNLPPMFVLGPRAFDAPNSPLVSAVETWNPQSLAESLADITKAVALRPTSGSRARRALFLVLRGILLYRNQEFPGTEELDIWVEDRPNDPCLPELVWSLNDDAFEIVFRPPIEELNRALALSQSPLESANILIQRAWSRAGFYNGAMDNVIGNDSLYWVPGLWSLGAAIADLDQALQVLHFTVNAPADAPSLYEAGSRAIFKSSQFLQKEDELRNIVDRKRRAYALRLACPLDPCWGDLLSLLRPGGTSELYTDCLTELINMSMAHPLDPEDVRRPVGAWDVKKFLQGPAGVYFLPGALERFFKLVSPRQ